MVHEVTVCSEPDLAHVVEPVPREAVMAQVERILFNREFGRSSRLGRFLRYIVVQTLDKNVDALRERQIGIAIFDRPLDWETATDNVVRSEARRLRTKLETYFDGYGKNDPIKILVPKGGYSARIEVSHASTAVLPRPDLLPVGGFPETPSRPLRALARIAMLVSLCILTLIVIKLTLFKREQTGHNFKVHVLSAEFGEQFSPAISPDGKRILFVWDGDKSNYDLYVKDVLGGPAERLTQSPNADLHPTWSPDGAAVAFIRSSGGSSLLIRFNLSDRRERVITTFGQSQPLTWASDDPHSGCQSLAWTHDGTGIVMMDQPRYPASAGLIRVSANDGAVTALTTPSGQDQDCYPRISPDGSTLAFIRYVSHGAGDVYLLSMRDHSLRELTYNSHNIRGLDWDASGRSLVFISNEMGAYEIHRVDTSTGRTERVLADTAAASDVRTSTKSQSLVYSERDETWNIWSVPIADGGMGVPTRLISSFGHNHSPSYSPDGRRIAFVSDRSGAPEIWFANADGTLPVQMTHFGGPWLGFVRWSPDGTNVVFDARPRGHAAIYVMKASGGSPEVVIANAFELRRPEWSTDGGFIYFDTTENGKPQISRKVLSSGVVQTITAPGSMAATRAAGAKGLFFESEPDGSLWRSDADGSTPHQLPSIRPNPTLDWVPTSAGIWYLEKEEESTGVYFYSYALSSSHLIGKLSNKPALGVPGLSVSPDGRSLLFTSVDFVRSDIKLRSDN